MATALQDRQFADVAAQMVEWAQASAPTAEGASPSRREDCPWLAEPEPELAGRLRQAYFAGYTRGYVESQAVERAGSAAQVAQLERQLREAYTLLRAWQDAGR